MLNKPKKKIQIELKFLYVAANNQRELKEISLIFLALKVVIAKINLHVTLGRVFTSFFSL